MNWRLMYRELDYVKDFNRRRLRACSTKLSFSFCFCGTKTGRCFWRFLNGYFSALVSVDFFLILYFYDRRFKIQFFDNRCSFPKTRARWWINVDNCIKKSFWMCQRSWSILLFHCETIELTNVLRSTMMLFSSELVRRISSN